MSDKPVVQWIQDSAGITTCHINDGKYDFKGSLIGTILPRADKWHVILKDKTDLTPEGCDSHLKARATILAHFEKSTGAKLAREKEHADYSAALEDKEAERASQGLKKYNRMTPRDAQKGHV